MSGFWIGVLAGLAIGGTAGFLTCALCVAASDSDRRAEEQQQRRRVEPMDPHEEYRERFCDR